MLVLTLSVLYLLIAIVFYLVLISFCLRGPTTGLMNYNTLKAAIMWPYILWKLLSKH